MFGEQHSNSNTHYFCKGANFMTKEALRQLIAETVLATPEEMFQSCPPSEFFCGHVNATLIMAALERAGYITFKADRDRSRPRRRHC
jgi:hypothetical protein